MTASPVYRRPLPGAGELTLTQDDLIAAGAGLGGPGLVVSMAAHPVTIAGVLSRDEVRDLVQALDDWLLDSRP